MTGIVEPRYLLSHYQEWAAPTFQDGCIMLTIHLVRAVTPHRLMSYCFYKIDRKKYLRGPGHVPRFPVLAVMDGLPHVHCLIKPVPYVNEKRGMYSMEDLVRETFSKYLRRQGDVHVKSMSAGLEPLVYALRGQGSVQVMNDLVEL